MRPCLIVNGGVLERIGEKDSEYDLLSPPLFLPDTDSMGAFKDKAINLAYGEGIFEFRYIRFISQHAINHIKNKISGINEHQEVNPEIKVFNFLGFIKDDIHDASSLLSSVKGLCLLLEDIISQDN